MRTKHILTALAIPALFAACVADDFESSVTNGVEAKRAELSEGFKLNFEDPATRFDAGELGDLHFTYEAGDTIGGAIIDEYTVVGNEPVFTVVDYVSTNHPFVRDAAGEWNINHTMVEGNYLFYFPYNENNHARTAAQYSIPVLQDLSDENGEFSATAAVEKYNMSVGSQFLSRNDLNAHLQLVNIYGYLRLKVTIDNHYAGGYVDKVVLMADDNQFKLNGQISNNKVSGLFKNLEKSTQDYQTALDDMKTTAAFALDDKNMYYQKELNQGSSVMVAQAPEGTALVADAQNNKTFETYLVIPATDNYTNVKVYIYTTDGHVYVDENVDETDVNNITGGRDFDVLRNGIKRLEVSVKEAEAVPYVVTSEKDWNNYVELLAKNSMNNFIIAGEDFAVTNNTKYPTNGAVINVNGDLKVRGNNVTIKNVNAKKVIVEKGAKLTTDGTFAAEEVENNGTLVFAPVYDDEDEVVIYGDNADKGVELVNNMAGATLEIQAEGIAQFKLNNQIDATSSALPHGSVAVNGTLILDADSENSGEVEIAAAGSLRGQFTNKKEVTYPQNVQDDLITNRFTPTITNNGEIYVNNGTVTNNGTIVSNEGSEISCERSGDNQFINAGLIELEDGADLLISSNEEGEIKLSELDQTGWSVESGLGVVSYETKAADLNRSYDFSKTGTGITKLYITGTLGITNYGDNLNDVEVTRTGTLTLPASSETAPATLANLTVKDGATVTVASTNAVITTLVVEEGGRLNINAKNNVTTTTVINYGRVYVGGTFTTAMTEEKAKECGGEFRNTVGGDTGNIKFGQSEDEKKKAAFEAAMANLVGAYANNSTQISAKGIASWTKLTLNDVVKAGWDTDNEWTKTAKKAVVDAYNAWQNTTYPGNLSVLLDEYFTESIFNTGKTAAITKADAALKEGFAQLTPTTWLDSDVYTKASETADILNGTIKLVEGFQAYVRSDAYANTLNVAGSKALYLSAKDYVGDANDVPKYSYICTYAGAEEYEVMEALYKLKTQPEYTKLVGKIKELSDLQLNTLDGVKSSMRLIYSAYSDNTLNAMDKLDIERLGLDDCWESVIYDWNYTNESIAALRNLFN